MNVTELAKTAVVAIHMRHHAGINSPLFGNCRKDLCGTWHSLNQSPGDSANASIAECAETIRDLCKPGGWRLESIEREALAINNVLLGRRCDNCGSIRAVCRGEDMNEAEIMCCRECCQKVHHDGCKSL